MEDRDIIRLLQSDPQRGTEEMIRKYQRLCDSIAGRILPTFPSDADECVLDAFLKVWKNAKRLDPDRSLKGYLIAAVRTTCIDRLRSFPDYPFTDDEEDLMDFCDPADETVRREESDLIRRLIVELGKPDSLVMIRRYYLCQPISEIAAEMGLSEKSVKNRLYYAKGKLKKALTERGYGKEGGGRHV